MGAFVIFALPAIRPVKTHLSPISPSAFAMLTLHNNEVEKVTKLYGIKNCDTIKKARKVADRNWRRVYEFMTFAATDIDTTTLQQWLEQVDWATVTQPPRHHLAQAGCSSPSKASTNRDNVRRSAASASGDD